MYHIAAIQIQWAWRGFLERKKKKVQKKKTEHIGFLLEYSFWCAVSRGHPGLCQKSEDEIAADRI